jgi:hypothetical protein
MVLVAMRNRKDVSQSPYKIFMKKEGIVPKTMGQIDKRRNQRNAVFKRCQGRESARSNTPEE